MPRGVRKKDRTLGGVLYLEIINRDKVFPIQFPLLEVHNAFLPGHDYETEVNMITLGDARKMLVRKDIVREVDYQIWVTGKGHYSLCLWRPNFTKLERVEAVRKRALHTKAMQVLQNQKRASG